MPTPSGYDAARRPLYRGAPGPYAARHRPDPVMRAQHLEGAAQARQHTEPQHVDLEQPERIDRRDGAFGLGPHKRPYGCKRIEQEVRLDLGLKHCKAKVSICLVATKSC